uniref:Endoglucanase n=1 Tax=Ciona savignyi TaxID=51511 RepID=H2YYI5_CIOSA
MSAIVKLMLIAIAAVPGILTCIVPERGTRFGDFAKRSNVVLRVQANATFQNQASANRYEATFQVTGLFPSKSGGFQPGDRVTVGPFGPAPRCTPVSAGSQYILFLRRYPVGTGFTYGLRYNPISLTRRTVFFFGRLLAGKITGRHFMVSGCRELARPRNGKVQCTRESDYLDRAQTFHGDITNHRNIFFWDDKTKGVEILLAKATNSRRYKTPVLAFANWLQTSTYKIPGGMVWLNYRGANMHTANVAFLSLQAAELADRESDTLCFLNFSTTQLGFLTGSRSSQGYVVGLGLNSPRNPHHRASSCPPEPAACSRDAISQGSTNAHVLYGALVGGPDQFGRYVDRASDYLRNEVAIDFNAGFQSLVAGAKHWEMRAQAKKSQSGT